MAARKKKSSRPKPKGRSAKGSKGVKAAKSARPAARPKARPTARPKATPIPAASARGAEGVVYSDVRREAAMRRFLRQSG